MAGTNNFLQFNPGQLNQANDASYTDSTYRSGGIPSVPAAAPSTIHNKLYYQVSTMVVALAQMLANRNYNVSDASLSDLIAVLDNMADKNAVLPLTGGTMTGEIVLPGNPTTNLQAAPKQYVDTRLPLAGGTMAGNLILARDPVLTMEAATKQYVDNIPLIPTGSLFWFPASSAPSGFITADGSLVSRTTYAKLWTYAQTFLTTEANWAAGYVGYFTAGNGSSTFRLPNLSGVTIIGSSSTYPVGTSGGEATHTLSVNEMPQHAHTLTRVYGSLSDNGNPGAKFIMDNTEGPYGWQNNPLAEISSAGGSQSHNNLPPYVSLLPCLKI